MWKPSRLQPRLTATAAGFTYVILNALAHRKMRVHGAYIYPLTA
jgi:hypothetical protein